MERSCFFLRLLSALLLLFSQDQRAASYSFENCEIHENLRGRTKVLCYNRNLAEVPTNLPSKLDLLDLSQNKISSLGKSDFRMLNHLQILNVSQNKIYKIEEGTFMYTSCLESLNLTANKLSFLNSSIFDGLVNLTTLLLGSNRISRIEPSAFAHLKKLKVIDLSSNRLHVLTSMNALFNVESLEELHIKGNGLQNFSTKDIISMPKQLHELDVSCNPISLIDIGTPVLKNLLSFNVSLSNVSTVWQIEDPCFLKGLKTLYLGGMMMKPSEISELLQKLNCSLLETIHLNNLFLSTSDGLIEQVCLWQQNTKTLNLQHNLFTSMKPGTFENCTQLKHLNMAFNRMKRLPKTLFQSLHSFQSLSLANNNFTKVPNAVSNLSSLQSLDLSFNKIDRVFPLDFFCLNNLTSLSIAGNRISDLHSDLFSNLSRLQELNLQNNIITEIKEPFSDNLKMLETLILNQNNLDSLSKGIFRYLISLRSLNLADNRIVTIERGAFEGLRNLKNLVLGSNKISRETLHEGVFEGASSLAELQLFNNYINYDFSHKIDRNLAVSFLDPKTFSYTPTLQELDLSKNNFLNVSSALFQPIPNLTELHLNQNGLNSLSFVSGVNFSKLTLLRVAGNQIDVVTKKQIMALPYLLFLDLRQNPFICSCSNEMFVNWSLHDPKTQVLHFYQYTCASPPTSKGKKLCVLGTEKWPALGWFQVLAKYCGSKRYSGEKPLQNTCLLPRQCGDSYCLRALPPSRMRGCLF
uniref:Uncharacterized protein n=1 Tax=Salvator merianae TaxID=96440 RepID=A0A8D0B5N3_SALMN